VEEIDSLNKSYYDENNELIKEYNSNIENIVLKYNDELLKIYVYKK